MNPKGLKFNQYGPESRRTALKVNPACVASDGKGDVPAMFEAHDRQYKNCIAPGYRTCPWGKECRRKMKSCPRCQVHDQLYAEFCQAGGKG